MPGIEVGDIGTKLGYNGVDNGFLRFDKVRIPRSQHLCRFVHVDKDGTFSMKGDPRMLY
jgi:acyl-CoA oxidase